MRTVEYEFKPERTYIIRGPNGSGKSTLLLAMSGLLPTGGLAGRLVRARVRRGTCITFWDASYQLFDHTIGEVLDSGCARHGPLADMITRDFGCSLNADPHNLSFGQKKVLVLIRAALSGRPVMLLDEPFAGLDADWRLLVAKLLVALGRRPGSVLILTAATERDAGLLADEGVAAVSLSMRDLVA